MITNNDVREKKQFIPRKDNFEVTPYEFELKINDSIICQRYIKIPNFNKKSIYSIDIADAIDDIVRLIDEDLKSKSRVYCWYRYYPEFKDEEFTPKNNGGIATSVKMNVLQQVGNLVDLDAVRNNAPSHYKEVNRVDEFTTVYDRGTLVDGVSTYLPKSENNLYFTFKVDGNPVISKVWSGDYYPNFIRNSVDITNKRRYGNSDEGRMYPDDILSKIIHADRSDLIPEIGTILIDVCSGDEEYDTELTYGDTTYDLTNETYEREMRSWLEDIRKKKGY